MPESETNRERRLRIHSYNSLLGGVSSGMQNMRRVTEHPMTSHKAYLMAQNIRRALEDLDQELRTNRRDNLL